MMIDVDWRQPFIDYIREQKVPTDKDGNGAGSGRVEHTHAHPNMGSG
jgi:hypothetical protein